MHWKITAIGFTFALPSIPSSAAQNINYTFDNTLDDTSSQFFATNHLFQEQGVLNDATPF